MSDKDRLAQLIGARHPCVHVVTVEEEYARRLLEAIVGDGLDPYWTWTSVQGVQAGLLERPETVSGTENPAAALFHLAREVRQRSVCAMFDLAAHLDDAVTRRALREVIQRFREYESTLILVDYETKLPDVIAGQTVHLELSLPDADELEEIIRATLRRQNAREKIEIRLKKHDLEMIIRNLGGLTRRQAEQVIVDAVVNDHVFDAADINTVLARKRQHLQREGILEFIETPVDLGQIGGLRRLKAWLQQRRNALTEEAAGFGLVAPRGVLLLGVQGAGKSLCAKAIAAAWQRPLLRLDPGALYDRYVGESERRLRAALRQTEMMAPVVLWIDEIEKGFASAAAHSTDGGLSQRMFGTLLTWMQDREAPVFLIATANNIEALPPELLRKGRFDEIFFVDLPDASVRRQIFDIHLRKRDRDPDAFDLDALAEASAGYSGAEIEQAIMAALHASFADGEQLDTRRIHQALQASPPRSVTRAEQIAELRGWAEQRCVPAD